MFCKKCGNEVLEGTKFCSVCGTPIDALNVTQPIQQEQPVQQVTSVMTDAYGRPIQQAGSQQVSLDEYGQPIYYQAPKKSHTGLIIGLSCAAVAIIAAIIIVVILAVGGKGNIVGTWSLTEDGQTITCTFDEDGTGELAYEFAGMSMQFEYETDGDNLDITVYGSTSTSTYKIDGDELTITDGNGESQTLTRED